MIIPVRCFSCGMVVGNKYSRYVKLLQQDEDPGEALDKLRVKRLCCRRMLIAHVDVADDMLSYEENKVEHTNIQWVPHPAKRARICIAR